MHLNQIAFMTRVLPAILGLAVIACHSRDSSLDERASRAVADSLQHCGLTMPASLPRDSVAVRCAEAFVARNGYTDLPVRDTTSIAHEFIEVGPTPAELLKHRQNSLARKSVVLCHNRRDQPGFTVGFVAPADTIMNVGRAVSMDSSFREPRMEHPVYLPRAAAQMAGCAWIVAAGSVR